MASKRTYPVRTCQHPDCNKEFIPTDKRRVYCTPQCRSNNGNDKQNKVNAEVSYQRKLELCDQRLAVLYKGWGRLTNTIKESILTLIKVDLTIGTEVTNPSTGETIRWYMNYGLVCKNETLKQYCILSQEDIEFFEY